MIVMRPSPATTLRVLTPSTLTIGNDSISTGTFGALSIDTDQNDDGTNDYDAETTRSRVRTRITIVAISGVDARRLAGKRDVTIKVTNAEDSGSVELSQIEPQVGRPVTAELKDEDGSINVSTWQWEYVASRSRGGSSVQPGRWCEQRSY